MSGRLVPCVGWERRCIRCGNHPVDVPSRLCADCCADDISEHLIRTGDLGESDIEAEEQAMETHLENLDEQMRRHP